MSFFLFIPQPDLVSLSIKKNPSSRQVTNAFDIYSVETKYFSVQTSITFHTSACGPGILQLTAEGKFIF